VAIALAIRLLAALVTRGLTHPELNEYDDMAKAMLAGRGFTYPFHGIIYYSYAPPMHSWLSAISYWTSGSIAPLMLLQMVAGSALAGVTAAAAERMFHTRLAGLFAGLLVAVHPGLIVYNVTKSHPMTFDALFFSLALLQSFRLRQQPSMRRAVELGLIVGIGTLSRATIVIFLPLAALWLLISVTPSLRWPVVQRFAVAGLITVACLTPWTIRNYRIHHQFVFVLTTDGDDFWRGNNPNATGHSYISPGHLVLNSLSASELADLARQPNELAQSHWFKTRAYAFIREHPASFVRLTALKFLHFWWFAPQTGVRYPPLWFWIYGIYYVAALACAALGVAALRRLPRESVEQAVLIAVFLLGLSALQSLYYVEGRHRWAVEPMLLVLSGGGLASVIARRARMKAGWA